MCQTLEFAKPRFDLFVVENTQAVKAKGFYRKRRHHATENNGLTDGGLGEIPSGREISHKPTRKRVSSSRRVFHLLERKRRRAKHLLMIEHQHAIFAAFDNEMLGSPCQDRVRDLYEIG